MKSLLKKTWFLSLLLINTTACLTAKKTVKEKSFARITTPWNGAADYPGVFPWSQNDIEASPNIHVAFFYPLAAQENTWDIVVSVDSEEVRRVTICFSNTSKADCLLERDLELIKNEDKRYFFMNPIAERYIFNIRNLFIIRAYDADEHKLTQRVIQFLRKS